MTVKDKIFSIFGDVNLLNTLKNCVEKRQEIIDDEIDEEKITLNDLQDDLNHHRYSERNDDSNCPCDSCEAESDKDDEDPCEDCEKLNDWENREEEDKTKEELLKDIAKSKEKLEITKDDKSNIVSIIRILDRTIEKKQLEEAIEFLNV